MGALNKFNQVTDTRNTPGARFMAVINTGKRVMAADGIHLQLLPTFAPPVLRENCEYLTSRTPMYQCNVWAPLEF